MTYLTKDMLTWTLQWLIQNTVTDTADQIRIWSTLKPLHIICRHPDNQSELVSVNWCQVCNKFWKMEIWNKNKSTRNMSIRPIRQSDFTKLVQRNLKFTSLKMTYMYFGPAFGYLCTHISPQLGFSSTICTETIIPRYYGLSFVGVNMVLLCTGSRYHLWRNH